MGVLSTCGEPKLRAAAGAHLVLVRSSQRQCPRLPYSRGMGWGDGGLGSHMKHRED